MDTSADSDCIHQVHTYSYSHSHATCRQIANSSLQLTHT